MYLEQPTLPPTNLPTATPLPPLRLNTAAPVAAQPLQPTVAPPQVQPTSMPPIVINTEPPQIIIVTATFAPSATPTETYTVTPSPTFTYTATETATEIPTATPTATYTETFTPSPTWTPSETPSLTPTFTATLPPALVAIGATCIDHYPSFAIQNYGAPLQLALWEIRQGELIAANGFWQYPELGTGGFANASAPAWVNVPGLYQLIIYQSWDAVTPYLTSVIQCDAPTATPTQTPTPEATQ
ncbi:MAG: hypothetical protein IPK17_01545 [Chloroflexi bacterium]|uniref:hypothetical protein n=1 Tax=Candidatus Flexifilum breve TaxID=3140694 RepID=UPI003136CCD0|nr:hypothetical protein [Chloroflexota bacterium]